MSSEHEDRIKCVLCRKPTIRSQVFAEGICQECSDKSNPERIKRENITPDPEQDTEIEPKVKVHKHYWRKDNTCKCGVVKPGTGTGIDSLPSGE